MDESLPSQYEIRVLGHLAPHRLACFENLTITHQPDGETVLVGTLPDQSALFGLLNHIYRLGVTLLSIHRVAETNGE